MEFVDVSGLSNTAKVFLDTCSYDIKSRLNNTTPVFIGDLEPYQYLNPYSEEFSGKRILVIHPFEETIKKQYQIKSLLFDNKKVIPDFHLETIKAVQSVAGNNVPYRSWFDALQYMKDEIDKKVFDIALIGWGAYGFHLGAHIKRNGGKAIHLGGALQLYFGIKGNRWIGKIPYINDNWIFPLDEDTPKNTISVENAAYWK